ncbi:hypothetical protein [Maridesulfovibrio sp.]|uniref:hypothetical protein n=1 Tax=Maridesulfovibrio sp. TaxID=2795000 RepID=UPI0029F4A971|nr:hypothetical protein [Maridesulfovibrio sp.]
MRYFVLIALLLLGGCTSWQNPTLDLSVNRSERFKMDRNQCRKRSQNQTHAAPDNDLPKRTYSQNQNLYVNESKAFQRCMSAKGWIKK